MKKTEYEETIERIERETAQVIKSVKKQYNEVVEKVLRDSERAYREVERKR